MPETLALISQMMTILAIFMTRHTSRLVVNLLAALSVAMVYSCLNKNSKMNEGKAENNPIEHSDTTSASLRNKPLDRIKTDNTKEKNEEKIIAKEPEIISGFMYVWPRKRCAYSFHPNEFVSILIKKNSNKADTIKGIRIEHFSHVMMKKYKYLTLPAIPWLNTYYVPNDSVQSWYKKGIIQGQYIRVEEFGDGLLDAYFEIHFKEMPTPQEKKYLIDNYSLVEFDLEHAEITRGKEAYFAIARIDDPRAEFILKQRDKIAKEPIVDWVQNNIYSGEPTPTTKN